MKEQTKKFLARNIVTHASAVLAGYFLALIAISAHKESKFEARQNVAVYMTNARGSDAELNREIFNPGTFESIAWQYNTNQRVGEVLGKTAADSRTHQSFISELYTCVHACVHESLPRSTCPKNGEEALHQKRKYWLSTLSATVFVFVSGGHSLHQLSS